MNNDDNDDNKIKKEIDDFLEKDHSYDEYNNKIKELEDKISLLETSIQQMFDFKRRTENEKSSIKASIKDSVNNIANNFRKTPKILNIDQSISDYNKTIEKKNTELELYKLLLRKINLKFIELQLHGKVFAPDLYRIDNGIDDAAHKKALEEISNNKENTKYCFFKPNEEVDKYIINIENTKYKIHKNIICDINKFDPKIDYITLLEEIKNKKDSYEHLHGGKKTKHNKKSNKRKTLRKKSIRRRTRRQRQKN
jgi:hypothetical protein